MNPLLHFDIIARRPTTLFRLYWPRPTVWRPGPDLDYRLLPGVRQPHLQFVDWQRHAPLGHPQEQLLQSQAPQQVVAGAV